MEGAVEAPNPKKGAKELKTEPSYPKTHAEKVKALVDLSKVMDAEFKVTGSLIRLGDRSGVPVPSVCTNCPSMDHWALGCGGVPEGRIIEIFGPESAGKTTITLDWIAQFQKAGRLAAFVDAEHALDPQWAALNGVDVDSLFISQPDYGEQALQIVERLIDSHAVGIIVVDSVTALVPKAELEGEIGDQNIGLQARMMSQAMRILVAKVAKSKVTLVFINQIRDKIGVMFGNPETTTGGKALKFFASQRIDVRKTKMIGESGNIKEFKGGDTSVPIGNVLKIKVVKNKVAAPFRETELHLLYETGIDRIGDMITFADKIGVFSKRGSWIDVKLDGVTTELGNGIAQAKANLKASKDLQAILSAAIYNVTNPPKEEAAA